MKYVKRTNGWILPHRYQLTDARGASLPLDLGAVYVCPLNSYTRRNQIKSHTHRFFLRKIKAELSLCLTKKYFTLCIFISQDFLRNSVQTSYKLLGTIDYHGRTWEEGPDGEKTLIHSTHLSSGGSSSGGRAVGAWSWSLSSI